LANDGTNRRISISNGSTSDRIVLGYTASSNQLIVLVSSNSVSGVASIVNIDNSLPLKFGKGQWATKVGSTLAYNDEGRKLQTITF
jgi:hypothetical protein